MTHSPHIKNPLAALLQNGPARQRCIQHVAEHLSAIEAARAQGHTWDAIAHAMAMRRPTLINAFNTLLARRINHRAEGSVVSTTFKKSSGLSPATLTPAQSSPALGSGIVALGRTDPNKFNI